MEPTASSAMLPGNRPSVEGVLPLLCSGPSRGSPFRSPGAIRPQLVPFSTLPPLETVTGALQLLPLPKMLKLTVVVPPATARSLADAPLLPMPRVLY